MSHELKPLSDRFDLVFVEFLCYLHLLDISFHLVTLYLVYHLVVVTLLNHFMFEFPGLIERLLLSLELLQVKFLPVLQLFLMSLDVLLLRLFLQLNGFFLDKLLFSLRLLFLRKQLIGLLHAVD